MWFVIFRHFAALATLVTGTALAQDPLAGRAVTEALAAASEEGMRIVYSSALVSPALRIEHEPAGTDTTTRLREALAEHGLALQEASTGVWSVVRSDRAAISGYLTDSETGQALVGARVEVSDSDANTRTRSDGWFFLWDLAPGTYQLSAVADDTYQSTRQTVLLAAGEPLCVRLALAPKPADLEQVSITTSRYTVVANSLMPPATLDQNALDEQPALFDDGLRSLRRFPGTAGSEFSGQTYVRGGDANENLTLVDGVPILRPFHFEGLPVQLGVLDPSSVAQIDLYSGVLPAEYGGRMSSVVNVRPRRAAAPRGGRASVGLLNASARLDGALPEAGGDWFLAGRRGLLDLLSDAAHPDYGHPATGDGIGELRLNLRPETTVAAGALGSVDKVSLVIPERSSQVSADSRYAQTWLGVEQWFGPARLASRASFSSIHQERRGSAADAETIAGRLLDNRDVRTFTLSQDLLVPQSDFVSLQAGWLLARSQGDYVYEKEAHFAPEVVRDLNPSMTGDLALAKNTSITRIGAYVAANVKLPRSVQATIGLRNEWHEFDGLQRESALDPRLSFMFAPSEHSRLRMAWGKMSQFPIASELPLSRGQERYDRPAHASLALVGWDYAISPDQALRVEIYDKRWRHVWPRFESRINPLATVPELEPDQRLVAPERSRAYGIDLYFTGRLTDSVQGWLSISRSRALDVIAGVRQPRNWDQPWALRAGATLERWGWTWSSDLSVHTGWPATRYTISADGSVQLDTRNGSRHPTYAALDLRTQRSFPLTRGRLQVVAELTNVTDRENRCCARLQYTRDANGALMVSARQQSWLPVLPFVTLAWEF